MKNNRFADISNSILINCIDEWIKNEQYRQILKRRYVDGISYEKLAEEQDLSIRQVKNIIKSQSSIIAPKLHF